MNIKSKIFSAILVTAFASSTCLQCTSSTIDYKKHLFVTGHSFVGLYAALQSLQAATSSFVLADYQLQHDVNNATFVAKHVLNAAKVTFFGLASFFSLRQAYKLSRKNNKS